MVFPLIALAAAYLIPVALKALNSTDVSPVIKSTASLIGGMTTDVLQKKYKIRGKKSWNQTRYYGKRFARGRSYGKKRYNRSWGARRTSYY